MEEKKPKEVFVISPIGADGSEIRVRSDKVLEFIIREALPKPEFVVRRGDEESSPDKITSLVVKRIREADLVVADITGHNPNVFYELAIAHGYQRPVVHLGQKGEALPFDIADMRTIFYDVADLYSVRECIAKVKEAAKTALADPTALKTPLTNLDAFSAIREQAPPGSADAIIASTLQAIQTKLDRLESRIERNDRDSLAGRRRAREAELSRLVARQSATLAELSQLRDVLAEQALASDDREEAERRQQALRDDVLKLDSAISEMRETVLSSSDQ